MMIRIFAIIFLVLITESVNSQVLVGKTISTNSDVSMEFGVGNKGLVLPWVSSTGDVVGAVDGTLVYDLSDNKVKYRKAGDWFDLSVDTTGSADATVQLSLTEEATARSLIGSNLSDTAPGVLVLTDPDKAMILPQVEDAHLSIVNPSPGMIVYDPKNKHLAVYNGTVWSFWKP